MLYNVVLVSAVQRSESAIYIPLSPFPSRLGHDSALGEVPVLYSRFLLIIYFIHGCVYMSIPISQFITPTFPPWEPYICFIQLFLLCFVNKTVDTNFFFFRFHVYAVIWYLLTSPCMTVYPYLYKWPNFIPFYVWVIIFHYIHMYHIFSVHSSVDGHVGGFHVLVIVNNVAVNIGVHIFLN